MAGDEKTRKFIRSAIARHPPKVVPLPVVRVERLNPQEEEIFRLRAALAQIADGDAFFDGAAKFMKIARDALAG
jgi:hypothetical protein